MPNLLQHLPQSLPVEMTETLAESSAVRIERIVSTGQHSPPDFWYDQEDQEWVCLLCGEAELEFYDQSRLSLKPGDYVLIPAGTKHRVRWTSPSKTTVWLAVFYR